MSAVHAFLNDRLSSREGDLVTIIQHDESCRINCVAMGVRQARNIPLNMKGGDNNFSLALQNSAEVVQRSLAFRPLYNPMLLFMFAGGWYDGETQMQAIGTMGEVQVYTIGFGGGCDFAKMERLAQMGRGTCLKSLTGVELKEAFMAISSRMGTRVYLVAQ